MGDNNSQGSNNSLTSNSENTNENNKRSKKRSTKKEKYEIEREEFIKELNKILGINENNNYVYKCEIETNKEFEKYIKENMDKIRRMLLHNAKKYLCIFYIVKNWIMGLFFK